MGILDKGADLIAEGINNVRNSSTLTNSEVGSNVTGEQVKAQVNEWLSSLGTLASSHQALVYYGAMINGSNAVTGIHRFGGLQTKVSNIVASVGNVANNLIESVAGTAMSMPGSPLNSIRELVQEANALADELKNPNIEGIPIHADSEQELTDVKVSETLLIDQDSANKQYAVDNAVPQLRRWNVKGYLMSNGQNGNTIEQMSVIKPSLLMQRQLLQMYADSRKAVIFKTHDNRFYKVLISHFESAYTTQGLNALAVNISLVEFRTLVVEDANIAMNIMSATDRSIV